MQIVDGCTVYQTDNASEIVIAIKFMTKSDCYQVDDKSAQSFSVTGALLGYFS